MPDITIPSKDGGSFSAYMAVPAKLPAPALVVIQEIFGVNQEMRTKCDEYAAAGYIAVCPDLFWRLEPGIQLTDKTEDEWKKAFDLFNRFDVEKGVEDLRSTLHVLKGHAEGNGKVGCVGFCLGGKLAYLMAARTNIDCAVSYYGVGLDQLLEEAPNIKKPLLLHVAEKDKFVTPEAQQKVADTFKRNRLVLVQKYLGCDHAFARTGGEHYDEPAASLAGRRTLAFLGNNLSAALAA